MKKSNRSDGGIQKKRKHQMEEFLQCSDSDEPSAAPLPSSKKKSIGRKPTNATTIIEYEEDIGNCCYCSKGISIFFLSPPLIIEVGAHFLIDVL
jgi:hypothetical protein